MTPRCFDAWSEGRSEAAKLRADEATMLAWRTAMFTRTDKRLRLENFLMASIAKRKAQTPDAMLAAMREFQAIGAPMTIKQVN